MQTLKEKIKKQHIITVLDNKHISADTYRMELLSEEIAANSKAGQFVSVLCNDMILRRPFSIAKATDNIITLIYSIKGQGTEYMSSLKNGDNIDLIGPLGNGFNITADKSLLLGAGVGIAPMLFLLDSLKQQNIDHYILSGFKSHIDIAKLNTTNSKIITEDGSSGIQGYITSYLEEILIKENIKKIYACGPLAVIKFAVDAAKKHNIDIEVAMERKFACGVGVCMGCNIKIKQDGQIRNKRICKDGPVFNGKNIIWNNN